MNKLLSAIVILAVLLTLPVATLAEDYDDALDAAFDAGSLAFAHADFPLPDPETCEIVMPPDALWQFIGIEPMDEAQIRAALRQADVAVCSYAPDGQSGIGLLAVGGAALPFALSPGRLAIIWPNEERGVYDQYGMPGTLYKHFYLNQDTSAGPFAMGEQGAIWSPGGRYCCTLNGMRVLQQMRVEFGAPLILDTQTGELFAVDSFGPQLMRPDGGFWIDGCFAGDESAFYAVTYSNRYAKQYTLVRYDLETYEAAPCAGFEINSLPAMTALGDGSMFALIDTRRQDEPQALARVAPDGSVETREFMLADENWRLRAVSACGSAESGWTLLRGAFILREMDGQGYFGLVRLRPGDDLLDGTDTIWALSAESGQFEALGAEQLSGTMVDWVSTFIPGHMQILDVALSPGGRYAAVFAAMTGPRQGETALLIVRLSDMAVLPAQGVDIDASEMWVTRANRGRALMSWSEAGLLLTTTGLWQPEARN